MQSDMDGGGYVHNNLGGLKVEYKTIKEIWLGIRTGGKLGSGSKDDPFAAQTQLLHDAKLTEYAGVQNVIVRYHDGEFLTKGFYGWKPTIGWRIVGNGKFNTSLKQVFLSGANTQFQVIGPANVSTDGDDIEIHDLTIDSNRTALISQYGYANVNIGACGARSGLIQNVRSINAGGPQETFIIFLAAFGPVGTGATTAPRICRIIGCDVKQPSIVQGVGSTAFSINAGYFEFAIGGGYDVAAYGGQAIIRDCVADGGAYGTVGAATIIIGYQIGGFHSALVQGCYGRSIGYAYFHDTFPQQGIKILDNTFDGCNIGIMFNGGPPYDTSYGIISHNNMVLFDSGIATNDCNNMLVEHNTIRPVPGCTLSAFGALIFQNTRSDHVNVNNLFRDNRVHADYTRADFGTAAILHNNRYFDETRVISIPDSADLATASVFVDKVSGNDTSGIRLSRGRPFKTIAAAITAASANDTVFVVAGSGTYDEKLLTKNNITVVFEPGAKLLCTASHAIESSAINHTFTVWSLYNDIVVSGNLLEGVYCSHAGTTINVHGNVGTTGTAGANNPIAVSCYAGTINVWGNVSSVNHYGVGSFSGTGTTNIYGNVTSLSLAAISPAGGTVTVINGTISGVNGVAIYAAACSHIYKRCTLIATATGSSAVDILTNGSSHKPIFRDCVLVSGATATQSINSGAQSVILYGETVANKGANPPTNITFVGGGTYAVDANVIAD